MKSKFTAAILAFLFGSIGIHRFYLGKPLSGIGYILLCLAYPVAAILISLVECLYFLCNSKEYFDSNYNKCLMICHNCKRQVDKQDAICRHCGNVFAVTIHREGEKR